MSCTTYMNYVVPGLAFAAVSFFVLYLNTVRKLRLIQRLCVADDMAAASTWVNPGPRIAAMAYAGYLMDNNVWTADFSNPAYEWHTDEAKVRKIVEAIEADCKKALEIIEKEYLMSKPHRMAQAKPHIQSRAAEHADRIWKS